MPDMDRPAEFRFPVRRVALYAEAMRLSSRRDWRRGGWALGAGAGLAVLSRGFALGSRLLFVVLSGRFALGVRSLFVRPCRYCVFVCLVGTRGWSARRCGSCRGVLRSVCARCLCVPVGLVRSFVMSGRGAGLRGDAVLLGRFASVHACLFSFVRKKETACGILRSYSAGRDRHSYVLAVLARLSALAGSLRAWPFLYGDLDGVTGDAGRTGDGGYEETGLAARRLCVFAQSHWL